MKNKLIAALIVGSFVLAGCGGGSSDSAMDEEMQVADQERIDELEEDLEEPPRKQARLERAAREREQAAREREQAAREREQAAREREQAAREQAEAEQERLEMVAEEATAALNREQAQDALAQLTETLADIRMTWTVSSEIIRLRPRWRAIGPFAASARVHGWCSWYVTRFTNLDRQRDETLVVYSDVGAPTSELLTEIYDQRVRPRTAIPTLS